MEIAAYAGLVQRGCSSLTHLTRDLATVGVVVKSLKGVVTTPGGVWEPNWLNDATSKGKSVGELCSLKEDNTSCILSADGLSCALRQREEDVMVERGGLQEKVFVMVNVGCPRLI